MLKIAVLISGGGTNLQALIDAQKNGVLHSGSIALVVSDRAGAYGLTRAEENGIATCLLDKKAFADRKSFHSALSKTLADHEIDLVILGGFLSILEESLTIEYDQRMINVHPSLIPSFCGEGFYGLKVHEAALARGVKITGATVHYVNGIPDGGDIILQKAVSVKEDDTPQSLQRRVMEEAEWIILPEATEQVCQKLRKERKV